MSKKYNLVKKYYNSGFWTTKMVYNAVIKNWITEREYNEIVQIEEQIGEEASSVEEISEKNEENSDEDIESAE